MRARLESPRASYATPGFRIGTTRAPRRRQLPTKRCHAALLFGATRAYQPDSSSKPLHRQPRAGVLGKSSMPTREILGRQHRPRDRGCRHKPLDGWSFHISYEPALGPVNFRAYLDLSGIADARGRVEWIIVGGESGARARPF